MDPVRFVEIRVSCIGFFWSIHSKMKGSLNVFKKLRKSSELLIGVF